MNQKLDEVRAKADLIELGGPDINGYKYLLAVTTQHGIKAAQGSKTKSAAELQRVVMETVGEVKALYPHGICVDISFHSDVEKGFTACSCKKKTTGSKH